MPKSNRAFSSTMNTNSDSTADNQRAAKIWVSDVFKHSAAVSFLFLFLLYRTIFLSFFIRETSWQPREERLWRPGGPNPTGPTETPTAPQSTTLRTTTLLTLRFSTTTMRATVTTLSKDDLHRNNCSIVSPTADGASYRKQNNTIFLSLRQS